MSLPKRYTPAEIEPDLSDKWYQTGTYNFHPESSAPVYSIDTPPATVSGKLHLGHTYSYSHPDFIARFWRMNGYNVFYPMGFDDNGLPTGRLVETQLGLKASQIGRQNFVEKCLQISEQYGDEYRKLWQHLGLSIDWRYTYRTISSESRKISQFSFLKLFEQDLVYRKEAPTIWCPKCETAIAQAEIEDINHSSEFVNIKFPLIKSDIPPGLAKEYIEIATTRPELLPACVAIFIHPKDQRYANFIGATAKVPLFNQSIPILADSYADPDKGTGAVMCCTFGDQIDVAWWNLYGLPLVEAIDRKGRLTSSAHQFQGLKIDEARLAIKKSLIDKGLVTNLTPINHSVRVHERCHTPVEYIITPQWFVRVLDYKEELLQAGKEINWVPSHMLARFSSWVENLSWDWCISRQRFYGVPFPVWYCANCGEITTASVDQLPLDPQENSPLNPCPCCGSNCFLPETDIMDTWATSSLTPQIAGHWLEDPDLYHKVTPYSLRPQAHEIIRTWAFYTILKSKYHWNSLPWKNVLISGWGIAGEGMGKISKSRGGGPLAPLEMIRNYSADAVRYWAASTGPGKDAVINEEKIKTGSKLINKIWNVARFSTPFIENYNPVEIPTHLTTADKWALSKIQKVIKLVTTHYKAYDYAAAKAETEAFFWLFADNYIEMAKQRLYKPSNGRDGALYTLYHVLNSIIKLFAPILPYVTERIYQELFTEKKCQDSIQITESIHTSAWPSTQPNLLDDWYEEIGDMLIEIASQVRRYKSERSLPLNTNLNKLLLVLSNRSLLEPLKTSIPDLMSITRASTIDISHSLNPPLDIIYSNENIQVAIKP